MAKNNTEMEHSIHRHDDGWRTKQKKRWRWLVLLPLLCAVCTAGTYLLWPPSEGAVTCEEAKVTLRSMPVTAAKLESCELLPVLQPFLMEQRYAPPFHAPSIDDIPLPSSLSGYKTQFKAARKLFNEGKTSDAKAKLSWLWNQKQHLMMSSWHWKYYWGLCCFRDLYKSGSYDQTSWNELIQNFSDTVDLVSIATNGKKEPPWKSNHLSADYYNDTSVSSSTRKRYLLMGLGAHYYLAMAQLYSLGSTQALSDALDQTVKDARFNMAYAIRLNNYGFNLKSGLLKVPPGMSKFYNYYPIEGLGLYPKDLLHGITIIYLHVHSCKNIWGQYYKKQNIIDELGGWDVDMTGGNLFGNLKSHYLAEINRTGDINRRESFLWAASNLSQAFADANNLDKDTVLLGNGLKTVGLLLIEDCQKVDLSTLSAAERKTFKTSQKYIINAAHSLHAKFSGQIYQIPNSSYGELEKTRDLIGFVLSVADNNYTAAIRYIDNNSMAPIKAAIEKNDKWNDFYFRVSMLARLSRDMRQDFTLETLGQKYDEYMALEEVKKNTERQDYVTSIFKNREQHIIHENLNQILGHDAKGETRKAFVCLSHLKQNRVFPGEVLPEVQEAETQIKSNFPWQYKVNMWIKGWYYPLPWYVVSLLGGGSLLFLGLFGRIFYRSIDFRTFDSWYHQEYEQKLAHPESQAGSLKQDKEETKSQGSSSDSSASGFTTDA